MANALADIDDLVSLVDRAAKLWPDATAWVFDAEGDELTFAEVDARSTEFASALTAVGVRAGDRVAVMLRNEPAFPLLWLALAKLSAILVPVNINYRAEDGGYVLRHSGARLAIANGEFVDLLNKLAPETVLTKVLTVADLLAHNGSQDTASRAVKAPQARGEQPANIQYTSGTTGLPKGCVLPHRYWTTLATGLATEFPLLSQRDVILTAQPFHYIDPQWNVAAGLASGAKLIVLDRFHPATFWHKVRQYHVTWFYCLGLMPRLLLATPKDGNELQHQVRAISASGIPTELHQALEQRWSVPWHEAFGMTETGADIRVSDAEHDRTVGTGCIGRPTRAREALIVDEHGKPVPRGEPGQLLLRGVGLMLGYHNDPEATERAFAGGWFHTGDLAKTDPEGLIYYLGRIKEMIRRSGENISASEVENVLLQHPAVSLAAVVGVPDELRGEEVKAYVVANDGHAVTRSLADALTLFCVERLAYFKVPRYWQFLDQLPRTPSERVAKHLLPTATGPIGNAYDVRDQH